MFMLNKKIQMPAPQDALPGRDVAMSVTNRHAVNGYPILPPFAEHLQQAAFALGCFWGAERQFWELPGVYTTAVGYMAGYTKNPTYQEVCSGMTGHAEVVKVVWEPETVSFEQLLQTFWASHDPTQGMRQGPDVGTQYRSGIYCETDEQMRQAIASRDQHQQRLQAAGHGKITTEILTLSLFYYAEDYHQQYLVKRS